MCDMHKGFIIIEIDGQSPTFLHHKAEEESNLEFANRVNLNSSNLSSYVLMALATEHSHESLYDMYISPLDICKQLRDIDMSKSIGFDEVPNRLLKGVA